MRDSTELRGVELRLRTLGTVALTCLVAGCASPRPVRPVASSSSLPLQPILSNAGFAAPENLVYDAQDNVYLISNMNGSARARDGNGFVSRVSADGKMVSLKWIDGSHPGTRLDAPKGLAIHGDTLVIADVGCVRLFNLHTGAALGVWDVPGVLMNDVSFAPDGTLYVTDTGPGAGKSDGVDHDAVFHFIAPNHPTEVVAGSDLSGPDGIVASDSDFVYATFGANRVDRITRSGARTTLVTLPGKKVDGLRELNDGSFVITSWDAHSVFRLMPNGKLITVASGINSPAGVAYDPARRQLAITSMSGNSMYLITLQ